MGVGIQDIGRRAGRLLTGRRGTLIITVMGLAAIALIFLSELLPKKSESSGKTAAEPAQSASADSDYTERTERQLAELLSRIRGVGHAELILTAEGSGEYIYAEETEKKTDSSPDAASESSKSRLFVSERSGSKDALVRKVLNPRFVGALVICEGGSDAAVRERVIKAVSAALDLPSSKICVESRIN